MRWFKRKRRKVWTTKDGEQIPIYKLKDSHLIHIVQMLERYANNRKYQEIDAVEHLACSVQGEMASFYLDQEFDLLTDSFAEDTEDWFGDSHPLANDLLAEAIERGLDWEREAGSSPEDDFKQPLK